MSINAQIALCCVSLLTWRGPHFCIVFMEASGRVYHLKLQALGMAWPNRENILDNVTCTCKWSEFRNIKVACFLMECVHLCMCEYMSVCMCVKEKKNERQGSCVGWWYDKSSRNYPDEKNSWKGWIIDQFGKSFCLVFYKFFITLSHDKAVEKKVIWFIS